MARSLKPGSIAARIVEFLDAHPGRSYHPGDLPGLIGISYADADAMYYNTLSCLRKAGQIKGTLIGYGSSKYKYSSANVEFVIPARGSAFCEAARRESRWS
jgi:hypothetical protein